MDNLRRAKWASLLLIIFSIISFMAVVIFLKTSDPLRLPTFIAAVTFAVIGFIMMWLIDISTMKVEALYTMPQLLKEVKDQVNNLDVIRKEYIKVNGSLEGLNNSININQNVMNSTFKEGLYKLNSFINELMQAKQSEVMLKEQINNYRDGLIEYCEALERELYSAKSDEEKEKVDRNIAMLTKLFEKVQFDIIKPQPGERFNETFHIQDDVEESEIIPCGCVVKCLNWGYRFGSEKMIKAKVVLAKEPKLQLIDFMQQNNLCKEQSDEVQNKNDVDVVEEINEVKDDKITETQALTKEEGA